MKWKDKRVDSLLIAEKSAKVRERLKKHQRVLDQKIDNLDYLQYRAAKNVDHQIDRVKSEISKAAGNLSLPLSSLRIPAYKCASEFTYDESEKGSKLLSSRPRVSRPSTAIGVRLDKVGEEWGGSDEQLDTLTPLPPTPMKKRVFGNLITFSRSPSVSSFNSDVSDSCNRSRTNSIDSRTGRQRPRTVIGDVRQTSSTSGRRLTNGGDKDEGTQELDDYNKKKLRWKHIYR